MTALPDRPQYPQAVAQMVAIPEATLLQELSPAAVTLEVRQQPEQALVMSARNRRTRKTIDPAPVIRMSVSRTADPTQLYLHNPHLFAVAYLELDSGATLPHSPLEGTRCSSLMRLKDVDDERGGFGQG
jgi:hypothetical protein